MGRTSRTCLAPGCQTSPYKGRAYCSQHSWMQARRDNRMTLKGKILSKFGVGAYKQMTSVRSITAVDAANIYHDLRGHGIHPKIAAQIADSSKAVFGGSIPDEPMSIRQSRQQRSTHAETRDAMLKSGVSKKNIVAAVLRGSNSATPDGDVVSKGDRVHVVMGIRDPRSKSVVLLDPSLARFAPLPPGRDDVLAEDAYSRSRFGTPFDDTPWIGTPEDIKDGGGYLSWSDVRVCPGDERSIKKTVGQAMHDYNSALEREREEESLYAPPASDPEMQGPSTPSTNKESVDSSELDELLQEDMNRRKAQRAERMGRA